MDSQATDKKLSTANWAVKEVDHLLSRVARTTRFVAYSKWTLVAVAALLLTVLVAMPLVGKSRSGLRVSFNDTQANKNKNAAAPVMSVPEYSGTGENGDQYKMTGTRAVQTTPEMITIDQLDARLTTPTGSWRNLTAERAEYQQEAKKLHLLGGVTMVDNQGYQFITEAALVDTGTMEVMGDQPISGTGPMGNLLASSFRIMDNGKRIIFYGGASQLRLTIKRQGKTS